MRDAPPKHNRMACDPLTLVEQIHLFVDGIELPLAANSPVIDYHHFYVPNYDDYIKVSRTTGRTIYAEIFLIFSITGGRKDHILGAVENGYGKLVPGNINSPGVYVTYPPYSQLGNIVGALTVNAYRINPGCKLSIGAGVQYGDYCSIMCKYATTRVPGSRVISVTDAQNKVYPLEGYNFIGCTPQDQAANDATAKAIVKALNNTTRSCEVFKPARVKVTSQSATQLLCGFVEVFDSPIKLKSIQMGDGKSYLFDNAAC